MVGEGFPYDDVDDDGGGDGDDHDGTQLAAKFMAERNGSLKDEDGKWRWKMEVGREKDEDRRDAKKKERCSSRRSRKEKKSCD